MERAAYLFAVVLAVSSLALACSDDDSEQGDGGMTTDRNQTLLDNQTPLDKGYALPDGYKLWDCSNPGGSCNAHDPCAINPVCGQDKKCRPEKLQDCSDGLACTADRCLGGGTCDNVVMMGYCRVGVKVYGSMTCADLKKKGDAGPDSGAADSGVSDLGGGPDLLTSKTISCCFTSGDRHPYDQCRECRNEGSGDAGNSTASTTWSAKNSGSCDDGDLCTMNDSCKGGICTGTSFAAKCSDGLLCTLDLCDGKGACLGYKLKSDACLINNVCYTKGAMNPSGACSACDPSTDQVGWTPVSNACFIDSKCHAKGSKNPAGCGECDPTTSTSKWTVTGTTCCLIAGKNYAAGAKDSTGCSSCDPTKDKYGWTPVSGKCLISGTCYASGAKHPKGCAECKPASSATAWTVTDPTKCLVADTCISNQTSTLACGKCGVACASGETCSGGKCSCGSLSGTVGGGQACPSGQACSLGKCVALAADTYAAPMTLDFELSKGKLTGTKDWEWGKLGNWKGNNSTNCTYIKAVYPTTGTSGMGVWGTKISDCYTGYGNSNTYCNNTNLNDDSILTLKVKLPATWTKATLAFQQWFEVGLKFDWSEIRIDGKVVVQTCLGPAQSIAKWTKRTLDLSTYVGKSITIKFHFMASTGTQYAGWYIDDLSVSGS